MIDMKGHRYKNGDRVRVGRTKLKVIGYDELASRLLKEPHYLCKIIGRGCIDSYPQRNFRKILG